MRIKHHFVAACAGLAALAAQAADWQPSSVFIQAGTAPHGSYSVTAGVAWPWQWRKELGPGVFTAQTEAFLSGWSGRGATGRQSFVQLGLLPVLRYRFGPSWFAEAGIGLSVTDRPYETARKTFSTRFNFADMLGVGYAFGADGGQELGVRVMHFSNAGIRAPNPGENFLLLRYSTRF